MKMKYFLFSLFVCSNILYADVPVYTTDNQVLSLPLMSVNGNQFYENVEIILDLTSGEFTIISGQKTTIDQVGAQTVDLAFQDTGSLFTLDSLSFVDVNDSRCPTGAQCFVAGEVVIGLELFEPDTETSTLFDLTLPGLSDEIDETGVQVNDFYFRLLEVSPYPDINLEISDSDYEIKVEYSLIPF